MNHQNLPYNKFLLLLFLKLYELQASLIPQYNPGSRMDRGSHCEVNDVYTQFLRVQVVLLGKKVQD